MPDIYPPSYGNAPYDDKPSKIDARMDELWADIDAHDDAESVVAEILADDEVQQHLTDFVRSVCNTGKEAMVASLRIRINELYSAICKREAQKAGE